MDDPGLFRGSGYCRTCATGQIPLTCAPVPPTARPPHPDDQTPRPDPARRPPRRPVPPRRRGHVDLQQLSLGQGEEDVRLRAGPGVAGPRAAVGVRLARAARPASSRPNGLVMTNHHCARSLHRAALHGREGLRRERLLRARRQAEERKCPAMEINQLIEIDRRHRAGQQGDARGSPARSSTPRAKAEMRSIEKECATGRQRPLRRGDAVPGRPVQPLQVPPLPGRAPGVRARGRHRLLRRRPGQLRVPPLRPRRVASCASTRTASRRRREHYFKWSQAGAKEGELTFVSGHPGGTERQLTVARAGVPARRGAAPARCSRLAELRGMLTEFQTARPRAEAHLQRHAVRRGERLQGAARAAARRCIDKEFFASKVEGGAGAAREGGRRTRRCRRSTARRGTTSPRRSAAEQQHRASH